jgi:predicted ATPase
MRSHDAGGPFSPFHEAMKGLCSQAVRKQMLPVLQRNAPHWLLQMPSMISDAEFRALRRLTADYKPGGILREMAEGLEALTAKSPLILVLEDLQWCDNSTLELISYLGHRREPARLLLIATYRPSDLVGDDGLLVSAKQELQMNQECQELILPGLSEKDVEEYLVRRFRNHIFPAMIAGWIHQRIGGNPLHMVNCLESMIAAGLISLCGEHWTLNGTLEKAEEMVSSSVVKYQIRITPSLHSTQNR